MWVRQAERGYSLFTLQQHSMHLIGVGGGDAAVHVVLAVALAHGPLHCRQRRWTVRSS